MDDNTAQLLAFLSKHPRAVMLTGAGISAESGIPTYRDADGVWQRSTPIKHQEFMSSLTVRRRYWLRSFKGWPAVSSAEPNAAHLAIAKMEALGLLSLTVTQNVDRLHQRAGSRQVVDLHGRLDEVVCMSCGAISSRQSVQDYLLNFLESAHPDLVTRLEDVSGTLAPDGDAEVEASLSAHIEPPACLHCGGILKPGVVFFGDSVPGETVKRIYETIESADALIVAGTSLQVFSGYRFCRHAASHGIPIASINPGTTRADELLTLQLRTEAGSVLPAAAMALAS